MHNITMATPKYKKMFDEMMEKNKALFAEYCDLQAKYDGHPKKYAEELSEMQRKVLRVIKSTENGLCARTETTGRGNYSTALADKFWEEVRAVFPRVEDYIETTF